MPIRRETNNGGTIFLWMYVIKRLKKACSISHKRYTTRPKSDKWKESKKTREEIVKEYKSWAVQLKSAKP